MFEVNQRIDPWVEFPALAAAIAAVPAPQPGDSATAAGARLRGLLMLRRQLDARLLAELAGFDSQGLGDAYGFPSTASWLRAVGYLDHAQASRMVSAARVSVSLPLLTDELTAGRVGVEHLEAVARTTRDVPAQDLAVHDKTLRDLTIWGRPSDMATAGKRITEVYRHDLAERESARLRGIRRFDFASTIDGLWHVEGLLPAEVGAQLATLVEPLTAPRGPEDDRTATQRRADAFSELLETALRHAPLADVAGERPRLTLLVSVDPAHSGRPVPEGSADPVQLAGDMLGRRGLGQALLADGTLLAAFPTGSAASLIGAQTALSPQTLARLACEADVTVATVDRGGNVLNLGRSSRFPNLAQRRALVVRDRGCVFPGCDRPPAGCIAHHLIWWSRKGRTDLDNLALVCHYHHHLVHDDGWHLQRLAVSTQAPFGGWTAVSPTGLELTEFRQPAA